MGSLEETVNKLNQIIWEGLQEQFRQIVREEVKASAQTLEPKMEYKVDGNTLIMTYRNRQSLFDEATGQAE